MGHHRCIKYCYSNLDAIYAKSLWKPGLNILQTTCRRVPIHKTCSQKKLAKCERRVIGTLINNYLTGKELFYRLNEQFVSNRAGNIIFCDGTSSRRAANNKHFASDLPTRADTQNFSRRKNY